MGLPHILSGAHVRAEELGDFGFEGRGGGLYLCRIDLAGTEFYVLLVLELGGKTFCGGVREGDCRAHGEALSGLPGGGRWA